ncbi:terminase small subunit [Moraxella osloensis]|uniref:terminase small subunit n=1 Tax=Faucicola osloensis TaxID=34062 RepID=UPI0020044CAB|nr:terminase small subunit [Moraxella osloensis]MCK6157372.1 terminase small subunit [Moraxella osloensis]
MAKLTPKQQRFVDEYLIDLNATQAAIRSGYSEKTAQEQGYQLLQKTSVLNAIELAKTERQKRTMVTQDDVIRGLLTEAEWQGEGSSHSARVSAWAHLGKHLNMFTDKIDHTSSDGSMSPNLKIEFINASNTGVGQV